MGSQASPSTEGQASRWFGLPSMLTLFMVCNTRHRNNALAFKIYILTIYPGESGLAGTDLLPTPARPADLSVEAVDAMAKAILAIPPNTCWLVATGTLTNVAGLVMKYPAVVGHLKGLSIMGGAIGGGFTAAPMGKVGSTERYGNWTPYAGELLLES